MDLSGWKRPRVHSIFHSWCNVYPTLSEIGLLIGVAQLLVQMHVSIPPTALPRTACMLSGPIQADMIFSERVTHDTEILAVVVALSTYTM